MSAFVRVVFEEGTQPQWLHDVLVPVRPSRHCVRSAR